MRIVVIGSVAAGTSVAAKARRNSEEAEIVVFEQDKDISYSICGIPYYVGGEVDALAALTPRDATWFKKRYNVNIYTRHRVERVDAHNKTVTVKNLANGEVFTESYDKLVLATGAAPLVPPVFSGCLDTPSVFSVRTIQDAGRIHAYIAKATPRRAVIVGAGMIGLEMAEQLCRAGLSVTLLQREAQVLTPMDADMAFRVQEELEANGVRVVVADEATEVIHGTDKNRYEIKTNGGKRLETDLLILAAGVRPVTELALQAGLRLGPSGAVAVDKQMKTSNPDVYAVGDVAENFSAITGNPVWIPMGSTANKTGRIAGDVLTGGTLAHRGVLGTGIVRVFGLAVAFTGLSARQSQKEGYEIAVVHNLRPDHADYLGGQEMVIKGIGDKKTGLLLGAQIVGPAGVDKRIDVFATAISFGAKVEDLFHLDLAYAPPFSTTKDPVHYVGMALDNAIHHATPLLTPEELVLRQAGGEALQIIDTRSQKEFEASHVSGAVHIPLAQLRERLEELDKNMPTVTYCNKGITGNAAQNVLLRNGFGQVFNLSGGNKNYQKLMEMKSKN